MSVITVNPATGQALATYEETTFDDLEKLLSVAHAAAAGWRATATDDRAAALRRLAGCLRARREDLALTATQEMGKPLAESVAEVEKCAWACEWFADHGPTLLQGESFETESLGAEVVYTPLGVVVAIMPWNYPYWQVIRALAPAVTAGNVVVLKHAPSTTGCALKLAQIATEAELPEGVLSVIVASQDRTAEVAAEVVNDDRVAAVTLTGSTRAGRSVAAVAGRALKKSVLELGGSDPFIVLADADIDAAAAWAARSRFQNAGQSCIATKRIIVVDSVADAFCEALLPHVAELKLGDPTDPAVTIGPVARADLRDGVARQVAESVAQGARALAGGSAPDWPGSYYEPTVLDHVAPEMPVVAEEVFGPAVPILRADNVDEAIRLANASRYGLGSNIWTADLELGRSLATRLEAGHTAVNWMTTSDPRLPFGGVKDSGYGRELSRHGLLEFVNVHTIVVEAPTGPRMTPVATE